MTVTSLEPPEFGSSCQVARLTLVKAFTAALRSVISGHFVHAWLEKARSSNLDANAENFRSHYPPPVVELILRSHTAE